MRRLITLRIINSHDSRADPRIRFKGRPQDFGEAIKLIKNIRLYQKMSKAVNPYGDGKAAERIVERLAYYDASLAEK